MLKSLNYKHLSTFFKKTLVNINKSVKLLMSSEGLELLIEKENYADLLKI